jgi:ABC-type nitrate/sulfonate/bicarbonate transport system substrate-binding protein
MSRGIRPLLVILLATFVSGCGLPPGQSVRLGFLPDPAHAQALVGDARGDFARAVAPIALDLRAFDSGPALLRALGAGEVDVAYVDPSPDLLSHARGHSGGLRVIAGAAAAGAGARDGSRTVVVSTAAFLDTERGLATALLSAHGRLTRWIQENPGPAARVVSAELERLTGKRPVPAARAEPITCLYRPSQRNLLTGNRER